MVDHVEPGTVSVISDLDETIPQESGTQASYGNNNIRNIKLTLKQTFPNFSGPVTASHTELNFVDGVTSAIQTQFTGKVAVADGIMDTIAVNTTTLVDNSGDIGIGTASPDQRVHVHTGAASPSRMLFTNSTTGEAANAGFLCGLGTGENVEIWNYENTDIKFATNNTEVMILTNGGRVGLGISGPEENVHVHEATSAASQIQLTNLTTGNGATDGCVYGLDASEDVLVWNYENTDMKFATNNTEVMILTNGGRLGLGLSGPQEGIHAHEATSAASQIQFTNLTTSNGATDGCVFGIDDSEHAVVWNYENSTIKFATNNSEAMRIMADGRVGIGTSSPHASSTLDVNGAIYQRGGVLHADYVFNDEYDMLSIAEHESCMWSFSRLPAMPISEQDEDGQDIVELGERYRAVVEELELAHVYIAQLDQRIRELEKRCFESYRVKVS